jgi:hypothetical protein
LETLPDTGSDGDFDALWQYTRGLQQTLAALPLRDNRPHDLLLYDENGLPK